MLNHLESLKVDTERQWERWRQNHTWWMGNFTMETFWLPSATIRGV